MFFTVKYHFIKFGKLLTYKCLGCFKKNFKNNTEKSLSYYGINTCNKFETVRIYDKGVVSESDVKEI